MADKEKLARLRFQVFSNPSILDFIPKHLSLNDIKSFRRVCRSWNRIANKSFHEKACINLIEWPTSDSKSSEQRNKETKSAKRFLEMFSESSKTEGQDDNSNSLNTFTNLNFVRYKLKGWNWKDTICNDEHYFWKNFGSTIKYLCLHKCLLGYGEFGMLRKIVDGTLVPSMTTLAIEHGEFSQLADLTSFSRDHANLSLRRLEILGPLSFENWLFLEMFPNLEVLKIAKQCIPDLFSDLQYMAQSSPSVKLSKLFQLDIMDTDQTLSNIPDYLPLTHLTFRIWQFTTPVNVINTLTTYSGSLEKLALFRALCLIDTPFPNFPREIVLKFPQLTSLELWGNFTFNFNFLRSTPALKRLLIDVGCYDKREILDYYYPQGWNKNQKYCPLSGSKIQTFIIPKDDEFSLPDVREFDTDVILSVSEWEDLKHWFPNLTAIKAPMNKNCLRAVCGNWSNLDHLKLRFPSYVDEGITGFANTNGKALADGVRCPNVTNLRELKTFELEVNYGTPKLTDFSVENGFLKMKSLQTLNIYDSDDYTQTLVNQLKRKNINVQMQRRGQWNQEEYCKQLNHHRKYFICRCDECVKASLPTALPPRRPIIPREAKNGKNYREIDP